MFSSPDIQHNIPKFVKKVLIADYDTNLIIVNWKNKAALTKSLSVTFNDLPLDAQASLQEPISQMDELSVSRWMKALFQLAKEFQLGSKLKPISVNVQ